MAVDIYITVEDVEEYLADDYDRIELERASTVNGSYVNVANITLVTETYNYSYSDLTGTLTSWYRYRFSDSGASPTAYTNPFQVQGLNLLKVRQHLIENYRLGMVFETNGGTNPVVSTNDSRIISNIHRTDRGKGQWLYIASGARIGEYRRIASADAPNGDFTVNPNLSGDVGSGSQVEWHWFQDIEVLNQCINKGLRRYWYVDRVPVTYPDDDYNEIDLSSIYPWITSKRQITGLWYYPTGFNIEVSYGGGGSWWNVREDGGGVTLMVSPIPTTPLYLESLRNIDPLHTDDSTLPSNLDINLIAAYAYDEILAYLTRPGVTAGSDVAGWKRERIEHAATDLKKLISHNIPKPRRGVPPLGEMDSFPSRIRAR